jgi:uncharacterized protein involved in exopolysaccharide biosynthesis
MENRLDFLPYLLILIRRRKAILFHILIIIIAAGLYAFLLSKKEYKAEIVFLPPEGGESSLTEIIGSSMSLPSMTSSEILPEQIDVIFSSKAFKRKIIEKFNLYDHYKMRKNANKLINTLKILDKSLTLSMNQIGNIGISKTISFTLAAYHTSADTAFRMANFAFNLLDSAVLDVSINRARRSRVFIEEQLEKNKMLLDSLQVVMRDFQVKNKAYDVPEQVKMSIKAYADLKAELMFNDIRMQAIQRDFSGQTPELIALQKNKQAIDAKLRQLEAQETPDAVPSLQSTARLLPEFVNQKRDNEIQNQIILFLSRELEQAKIKEQRNVSSLIVTDPAFVPEYKARPKRLTIMAIIVSVYMCFVLLCILAIEIYRIQLSDSRMIHSIKESFRKKQ